MSTNIEIDKFTPCLEKTATGEFVKTSFAPASVSDLNNLNWKFNWNDIDLSYAKIFKLLADGDNRIQGLIALSDFPKDRAIYVNIAESAPHNMGSKKEYYGVGGHLFAIAAFYSYKSGYGGFVFMDAKNMELVEHYKNALGAKLLGIPHPYRMFIDEDAAQKLLEKYTLEGL